MCFTVVGLGEVLWDLLPTGPQLGGAPANFAYHAGALGARAMMISRVGNDDLGREVVERFKQMNLPPDTLQVDPVHPTGTVAVTLNEEGTAQYTFPECAAWEQLAATESALSAVSGAHAVCFGTLGQRNRVARECIQQILGATPADALRIFDINLRLDFYSRDIIEQSLALANVLKLNDEELAVLTRMFGLQGDVRQRIEWFAGTFGLRTVVLTSGALGSLIYQEGRWSQVPRQSVRVVDTVGAGDAFTAALCVGLLSGMELGRAHAIATDVASYVCSRPGGTPPMPESFRRSFERI